jgi:hypothetical protein
LVCLLTLQEQKKSIIIHIVETFGERFKNVETFGMVEQINLRYAQYHDTSVSTVNLGTESERLSLRSCIALTRRHQQPNGVEKWGTGIREMDSMEEDYFNGDDDEIPDAVPVEEIPIEKPLELKRRRSSEDEDDELLQLAQKSPQAKGICPLMRGLLIGSDDSHGNKSSSSPPTNASPPEKGPREKRPRDTDEPDEMERMTRSSKRVISPTEVRRRPSRGTINGGRKIAISLGKK